MGGNRPQLLISIEHLLWQVILNCARSASGSTEDMLKSAFERIDGLMGEDGVDIADINWFYYSK